MGQCDESPLGSYDAIAIVHQRGIQESGRMGQDASGCKRAGSGALGRCSKALVNCSMKPATRGKPTGQPSQSLLSAFAFVSSGAS
eukprot:5035632-Prymnesium_polylepis.1